MKFQNYLLILLTFHVLANNALVIPPLKQPPVRCHAHEKAALLQFKQSFFTDCAAASTPPFAYPKMKTWQEHEVMSNASSVADCCTWDGVTCDKDTNFVIVLDLSSGCLHGTFPSNTTLFSLDRLLELNLADNNFNYSSIPSSIARLHKLRNLNLSRSSFHGLVPSEISSLSSLTVLDLSNSGRPTGDGAYSLAFGDLSLGKFVSNLTRLTQLYLDFVNISSVVPTVLSNMTSLTALSLSGCQLYGEFPRGIFQLPHLEVLVLYDNQRLVGHLPEFLPDSPLVVLDLREIGLSGELPSSIGNLGRLKKLSIDSCSFSGHIPSALGNLTKLTVLGLATNAFSGTMPSSLTNLTNLESLTLSGLDVTPTILDSWLLKLNKLSSLTLNYMNMGSKIPSNLANCTRLRLLNLNHNQLFGTLPQWLANLTQLTGLGLGANQLEGPVQPWLSKLIKLQTLDLSNTKSVGTFEQFIELPNIQVLYLNGLNLTFLPNAILNDSSLPKLTVLSLGLCNLTEFPQSLRYQNELQFLYMAQNNIGGHVPQWFVDATKDTVLYLNLSYNSLVGFEHPSVFLPWTNIEFLDLKSNEFGGLLSVPLNTLQGYDISNNRIHGGIPNQICLANSLTILDLSNNSMSGNIPHCIADQLGNSLQLLNLRGNNFHGTIPQTFHKSCSLRMINLSDNQLEGQIPQSLANCTKLEVLDLGKNRVNDTFPYWLGSLPTLQVLVLRHNHFHGKIKDDAKSRAFEGLRIIDLSHNFYVGTLPSSYLRGWLAMQVASGDELSSSNSEITVSYLQSGEMMFVSLIFHYVITITIKGSETVYPRVLTVFKVVDFSSNNFTGKIPSFIGDLKGLQALNLSNNHLEGDIPSSLSRMRNLQSLDLSRNMFSGVIPQELSKLTFLEVFNVSHNRLVGSIPQGPQFNTFDNSSFDGNLGLCGGPLSKKCVIVPSSPGKPSQNETDGKAEEDSDLIRWIITALGCASGFIVGFVLGKVYITDKYHGWFMITFGTSRKLKPRGRKSINQRKRGVLKSRLTM